MDWVVVFDVIVVGDDVVYKKLVLDVYVEVLVWLKFGVVDCVVIEDFVNGLILVLFVGLCVVIICSLFFVDDDFSIVWFVLDDLMELVVGIRIG